MKKELNIGIIGAGGFANFAAKAFLQLQGVKIIAVMDMNKNAAEVFEKEFDATVYTDENLFLANNKIDLVYIATPPFLHYEQSKKALLAGKHVICEKPAGLKTNEAIELQSLALSLHKLYVVNLMQRYNSLYKIVNNIIQQNLLGNFLHGFFENYASDENLNADHWFWEETKSGGIFIEHSVHFFDMFSGWLGEGEVVNSLQLQRPNVSSKIIDRVQATVLYNKGLVNFYHGFDQPKILDRQEMRLQFERGDITLYGWVPVELKIHGLFLKEHLNALESMLNKFSLIVASDDDTVIKKVRGRFNDISFNEEVTIKAGDLNDKSDRYIEILKEMLQDQWNWIKDRNHVRVINDKNAIDSLKMAEQATRMAQNF